MAEERPLEEPILAGDDETTEPDTPMKKQKRQRAPQQLNTLPVADWHAILSEFFAMPCKKQEEFVIYKNRDRANVRPIRLDPISFNTSKGRIAQEKKSAAKEGRQFARLEIAIKLGATQVCNCQWVKIVLDRPGVGPFIMPQSRINRYSSMRR